MMSTSKGKIEPGRKKIQSAYFRKENKTLTTLVLPRNILFGVFPQEADEFLDMLTKLGDRLRVHICMCQKLRHRDLE